MVDYNPISPIHIIIYKYIVLRKTGCIIGVTGRPGSGKSWLCISLILDWLKQNHKEKSIDDYLVYDVNSLFQKTFQYIKINGEVMTKEMFDQIDDLREFFENNIDKIDIVQGGVLMVDEAGTSIYVRDFFSSDNKAMGKLVQVWRFMRMLVVFNVPEKIEFMDKSIREFFDMKITMGGICDDRTYAYANAAERCGRNWKGEPAFKNIEGCKHRGFIRIWPLDLRYPEIAAEYELRAKKYKVMLIVEAGRTTDKEFKKKAVKEEKEIVKNEDIDEYVKKGIAIESKLRSKHGRISPELIMNEMDVSLMKARRIKAGIDRDMPSIIYLKRSV